jgi:hypothetical protein
MEKIEIKNKPKDLDDLLSGETTISKTFKGHILRFHFRELDPETDLAFQKRTAKTANGKPSDEARTAEVWLFHQLCTSVEVIDGENVRDVPDFKERMAPDVKRSALWSYRLARGFGDDLGN